MAVSFGALVLSRVELISNFDFSLLPWVSHSSCCCYELCLVDEKIAKTRDHDAFELVLS
uniref:Uncharacterized protein n=1 Tax=Rhizophora mucronata TaxID=61149 RepID=A0A2P2IZC9_RHIMU